MTAKVYTLQVKRYIPYISKGIYFTTHKVYTFPSIRYIPFGLTNIQLFYIDASIWAQKNPVSRRMRGTGGDMNDMRMYQPCR